MDNNMQYGYQPTVTQPGYGGGNQAPRKPGGRGKLIAGGVAAAVLVGGAAFGAVTMLSSSSPATAATGPTGSAAVLSDALTGATTTASTSGTGTAAATAAQMKHCRDALARLRRLGGIDGQFTFQTKSGVKTLAFERGTIQSVSGNDVVVKAKDGTTWNWTLVSDTVVREDGSKASNSALSTGELVFVGGPVVSGSHNARLIVVRDAAKSSGSSGATPSGNTSAMVS
jgi:hypothetical protein